MTCCFFLFAQDIAHADGGYQALSPESMSRALSLAGFQVTIIGRFWVTAEEILCARQLS